MNDETPPLNGIKQSPLVSSKLFFHCSPLQPLLPVTNILLISSSELSSLPCAVANTSLRLCVAALSFSHLIISASVTSTESSSHTTALTFLLEPSTSPSHLWTKRTASKWIVAHNDAQVTPYFALSSVGHRLSPVSFLLSPTLRHPLLSILSSRPLAPLLASLLLSRFGFSGWLANSLVASAPTASTPTTWATHPYVPARLWLCSS